MEPILLKDLVQYQEGSVVSKEIMKGENGNVTLFAFAQGQGLSEHKAPFDALAHVLDGQAQISISGTPFDVSEGQMIIMPADAPHALKAEKKFKMLLVMIKNG